MSKNAKSLIGLDLTCQSWEIEAAYRMIQNNIHPDVAETDPSVVRVSDTHTIIS